ncbi:GNAT family N-acetyltransferase [Turicibacter sanguinis]|uniref:GNAT family N-acetyltransferase n=1 Tax=Turicibacter sanguinis TaxID=154288 RepID=UPI0012BB55F8|nr:GNAT family N-acetyltransferase [Turicibacter sanguinis]MDB8541897.1 GNAT family N-acetyltransferase [Turicibacter sanguinis]MTP77283.1 GNAT family N-acetyltransferase [Turicibacter sanguinis]
MTGVKIQRLSDLGSNRIKEAAQFTVHQFREMFLSISEDEEVFILLFMKAMVVEQCFVAIAEDKVVGIVGVSTPVRGAFEVSLKEVQGCLGFFKGLKFYFNLVNSGLTLKPYQIYINTLAVDEAYRRLGIGTLLLEECMLKSCGHEYLLDVIDVNTGALKLYESLGFKVLKRKKQMFAKQAGFNECIYMSKRLR